MAFGKVPTTPKAGVKIPTATPESSKGQKLPAFVRPTKVPGAGQSSGGGKIMDHGFSEGHDAGMGSDCY